MLWTYSSRYEKSKNWYIVAMICILSLVVGGIATGVYALAIVAFLFAGVYIFIENNHTNIVQVEIEERGISVDGQFYEYSKILAYSILFHEKTPVYLRIMIDRKYMSTIDIWLSDEVDIDALRYILAERNIVEDTSQTISTREYIMAGMRL